MADERFDIGKLIRGFAIWKGEVLGKVIFVVIIVIVALGVFYVLFIRPTHRTTQKAETITNTTINQVEDAVDLTLFPPKIKIGGVKLKLFK
jgi:hypothetical protein